jgi:hypothetical protein
MMTIEEFYKDHEIDDDFDEIFYQKSYTETESFYQPYCLANNIDDKHRLFFHWYLYQHLGYDKYYKHNPNRNNEINKLVSTNIYHPMICKNIQQKQNNIKIVEELIYDTIN